jgi:hypothetical protein
MRTGWENPNLVTIRHITWSPQYVAWSLATLNHRKINLSNWNGVRLLVCPSVCMYQCGCYWTDVCEIWYWGLQWKYYKKFQIWLKSGTVHVSPCTLNCCQQHGFIKVLSSSEMVTCSSGGWGGINEVMVLYQMWWNMWTFLSTKDKEDSKFRSPQKKIYLQMATLFGIYFTVFTQMEDDPTVKTTPLHNTCTEPVTLCAWFKGNLPNSSCLIFW